MTRMAELQADALAEHAFNVFLTQGRHVEGARLIYRALQLAPEHPRALRCLSDFHAREGTEVFAAVALEYALAHGHPISEQERRSLDDLRFLSLWSWGFSRHKSGDVHLSGEAFEQRDDFTLDQTAYNEFLAHLLKPAGSLQAACASALRLCGALAGFLQHTGKPGPDFEDLLDPAHFVETEQYRSWLQTSSASLDELAQSVRRMQEQQVKHP